MKQFRFTKLTAIFLALLLAASSVALAACGKKSDAKGSFTLVLGTEPETELSVSLDGITIERGLFSILAKLKEEGKITYTTSADGTMLTSVGGVAENPTDGVYLWIWTSVEKDADTSAFGATNKKTYRGNELNSAGVGAAEMTFVDGAVVYIGTVKW